MCLGNKIDKEIEVSGPISTATIIMALADAFLGALAGTVAAQMWERLKQDSVRQSLNNVFSRAIYNYGSTTSRRILARPLLQRDGPLTEPMVMAELVKLVQFGQAPNTKLIGERWKITVESPPQWMDFTQEAKLLVECLRAQLRTSQVFGPIFDAQSLDSISSSSANSKDSLIRIEGQISSMIERLDNRFMELGRVISQIEPNIQDSIIDYSHLIEEKTKEFVGRQWIFERVAKFLRENPRGYFLIIGDPGIGKSSIASQLVKVYGCPHHFNIRAERINNTSIFIRNVCAQLITIYELGFTALPSNTIDNASFLNQVLMKVSEKLQQDDRCVIVIDALDEVETQFSSNSGNLLALPLSIPKGIYIVVTMRENDERKVRPRVACEQAEVVIRHDSSNNVADISEYIWVSVSKRGIQNYLAKHKITPTDFVTTMASKSEGNFIYLYYVLPELGRGYYQNTDLSILPIGLTNYYEDHWQRMRAADETEWFEHKLPIIVVLTLVFEPVSVDLLCDFLGQTQKSKVRATLRQWAPFIHDEIYTYDDYVITKYKIYHSSFQEFIIRQSDVRAERIDLGLLEGKIIDGLGGELLDNE